METSAQTQKSEVNVPRKALEDIAGFYNEHIQVFQEFEDETGVDFWFLQHFRLYFSYRNLLLQKTDDNYQNSGTAVSAKLAYLLKTLWEVLFILAHFGKQGIPRNGHLLLASEREITARTFGALHPENEQFLNREVLNPKTPWVSMRKVQRKGMGSDGILANYLLSWSALKELRAFNRSLENLWRQLKLKCRVATDQDKRILNLVCSNRLSFLIYFVRYRSFVRYFESSGVVSLFMTDENSPQQRVIQHAAAKFGVKVFGYQHGNIHRFHPAYMYAHYHRKPLLPTITFLWGKHFENMLLTDGGYSPIQVQTTGRISSSEGKGVLHPSLKAKDNIIIYASQPQRDLQLRKRQLKDVLLAVKGSNGRYSLVIRPHPAETENDFFNEIANEVGFDDFLIDRVSDLQSHMESCSVLVTSFSTVGSEFIPQYKPLVVLDYLKQDLVGWVKEGVGIPVRNGNELATVLLESELKTDKLAYDRFVEKYFYKLDGRAAERIKQAIDEAR